MSFTSSVRLETHHPTLRQYFAVRRFAPTLAFTPDSSGLLFSANISGQLNLWRLPVEGGWPRQLTTFEDRTVRQVAPAPDGATIVFTADRDGDEFYQLYAVDAGGGWPQPWTGAPKAQHYLAEYSSWDPVGRRLAFAANTRTPTDMEVWVRDLGSGEVRHAFGAGRIAVPVSFSPDGDQLLCLEVDSGDDDQRLHLVDLTSGTSRPLTTQAEPATFSPGPWAPDGSGFWVVSNLGREFSGLAFHRLSGDRLEWTDTPDGDIEQVAGDPAGRTLVWLVNQDGWGRLQGRDLCTGRPLPAADLPPGGPYGETMPTVSRDGRYAAVLWSQPSRAEELYLVELATGRSRRLTDNMLGGLAPEDMAVPALIRYPNAERRPVPSWVYRPRQPGRRPVVLSIHGGPASQERPTYQPLYQYLVSRGIAVLAPNIRGSTGYGRTYQQQIFRDWGGGDLADLRHAVEWLRAQDWVDPDRIGVFGGSYGGFATLSCLTRLPEYWAAGVAIASAANLVSWASSVPPTWRRLMARWVGDPETEADALLARSPISYADQLTAPLLMIQGAKDPRALQAESDRLVGRLRELDRPVDYVVFEDEGHGFTRRANLLRAMGLTADWFTRHLVG
jgi:dipeptidyl aminopeptidase/acylaminoacyl peptidase